MAHDWTLKQVEDRIVGAIQEYTASQGWGSEDYRLFLRVNNRVGRFHVFLVARDFPGRDIEEKWIKVRRALNQSLSEIEGLADSINLTLRTFDEFDQGGIYTPGPSFAEVANH
jgi:hypothetical protein